MVISTVNLSLQFSSIMNVCIAKMMEKLKWRVTWGQLSVGTIEWGQLSDHVGTGTKNSIVPKSSHRIGHGHVWRQELGCCELYCRVGQSTFVSYSRLLWRSVF